MLQLVNHTPVTIDSAIFADERGMDTLYLVAKASFRLGPKMSLLEPESLRIADEYWGNPQTSSLKYPGEWHLPKPATDIIVLGHAVAPDAKPVLALDVSVRVGPVAKRLRAFGDRVWRAGQLTQPQPFSTMPLRYERAYGGIELAADGQALAFEARNPVGRGFAAGRAIDGAPLPNLEDPANLIRSNNDKPAPVCFAAVAPHWQARQQLAGSYDQRWQRERAPFLPNDFSSSFFNCASAGLVCPGFLQGGEPALIEHMHPNGSLSFALPYLPLRASAVIGKSRPSQGFNLEMVLLEPSDLKLTLLYRAAFKLDKRILRLGQVEVDLQRTREVLPA